MIFYRLTFLVTLLASVQAFAAAGSVPAGTVISQLANLSILIGAIYFSQRKNIAKAFADKRESFLASVRAASNSKKEAEEKLKEVKTRVQKMQSTFDAQVAEAEKNAEESYRSQLADGKNEALRIKESAQTSLEFETQKQIETLRLETFHKSAGLAEKNLQNQMTPEQLKTWNNKFSQEGMH